MSEPTRNLQFGELEGKFEDIKARKSIIIYKKGFIYSFKEEVQRYLWGDVANYQQEITQNSDGNFYLKTSYRLVLEMENGKRLAFFDTISDVDKLAILFVEFTVPPQAEKALAIIKREGIFWIGGVGITPKGILRKNFLYAWEFVKNTSTTMASPKGLRNTREQLIVINIDLKRKVEFKEKFISFVTSNWKSDSFVILVNKTPNAFVLLFLINFFKENSGIA